MMRVAMSQAASGLLRALVARSGAERNRILLTEWTSVDWQSLTFIGERHEGRFRIDGVDANKIVERMMTGIDDAEFQIAGNVVADIAIVEERSEPEGRILLVEALTIAE